jgi:hypothetical protein
VRYAAEPWLTHQLTHPLNLLSFDFYNPTSLSYK